MNKRVFLAGAILLVVGTSLFFVGLMMIQEVQKYNVWNIPIDNLLMALDENLRVMYYLGSLAVLFGICFLCIGGVVFLVGIIKKEETIVPLNQVTQSIEDESNGPIQDDEAIKLLRLMYAKGEITSEEFQERQKTLRGKK